MRLADRLSINLEGANAQRLAHLAPKKSFSKELLPPLYWVHQQRHRLGPWLKPPSVVTQFVVGPAGETDQELLATTSTLYRTAGLARAYYLAFSPVRGTAFENMPKTDPVREHRLYQADWLLRFYGFEMQELLFDAQGNLPADRDPKRVWAETHLRGRPLEINRASRAELLRIPGIGPQSAEAIIAARRQGQLRDLSQLKALGAIANRAAPFVLLAGRRPEFQLALPGI
jgi:predicted DNA-binding helix-hairpin-helix protein